MKKLKKSEESTKDITLIKDQIQQIEKHITDILSQNQLAMSEIIQKFAIIH